MSRRFFLPNLKRGHFVAVLVSKERLSHSPATVAIPNSNSHVQSRSNITGSLAHDHSTPITPSTREHATQERPSFARHRSAESTLDNASLMKILAHHGTQPELEFSPALFPSASSCEDSITGDPLFPALYSIVVELPVHSSPIFLVRPGDTR